MELRKDLSDFLHNLDIEAYDTGTVFAIKGPTWLINPKTTIEDYVDDFISDEPGAMRDYAAVPTHSMTPFFTDGDVLRRKALSGKVCPISENLIISPEFKPNIAFRYFFAGDLSVAGDDTGISMVHYDFFKQKVVLDFSMAIHAERGTRVDYGPIRQLIYNLRNRGFNIKKAVFDQFQSNDSINQLRSNNIDSEQVQYAESFVGCTQLHELIHTDKFEYYDFNEVFIGEAQELQVVNSKRIDHLKTDGFYNSKDVWDSVVNATYVCIQDYYENGLEAQNNSTVSSVAEKLLLKGGVSQNDFDDISWIL